MKTSTVEIFEVFGAIRKEKRGRWAKIDNSRGVRESNKKC